MEVSVMFNICTYCVFTLYDRSADEVLARRPIDSIKFSLALLNQCVSIS